MEFFTTYVLPTLGVILSIMAPILAGILTAALVKWSNKLGYDIDAKNREAFQTSVSNAAKLAVSKMGGPAAASTVSAEAISEAVKFVEKSVPDAIKHFDIKSDDIAARIKPQAEMIVQSVPTVLDIALAPNPLINVVRKIT